MMMKAVNIARYNAVTDWAWDRYVKEGSMFITGPNASPYFRIECLAKQKYLDRYYNTVGIADVHKEIPRRD